MGDSEGVAVSGGEQNAEPVGKVVEDGLEKDAEW